MGALSAYGALMLGVYNTNTDFPMPTCSTGNCTWPVTPTLGMCSSCVDVKKQASVFVDDTMDYTMISLPSLVWPEGTNFSFTSLINHTDVCPYTLLARQGVVISSPEPINGGRLLAARFNMISFPPSLYTRAINISTQDPEIYKIQMLSSMRAYECSFHFCLQAFSASVTAGKPNQKLVETWDQWNPSEDGEDSWVMIKAPPTMEAYDAAYRVDGSSLITLAQLFDMLLNGDMTPIDQVSSDSEYAILQQTTDILMPTFWQASNDTDTMSALCARIAQGFTNFMRTSMPADPDTRYAPTVYSNETFVRVRWQWLMFPLGLLVAGHVFLVATILQTRRRGVWPWKGSRVPLLLASVDEAVKRQAVGGFKSRTGLEDRVGRMKMWLDYDNGEAIAFRRTT